jgi:hypothetical protein
MCTLNMISTFLLLSSSNKIDFSVDYTFKRNKFIIFKEKNKTIDFATELNLVLYLKLKWK